MGTPPYREWEHNASLSSINSKHLRHERLFGEGMGSTECRSFFVIFSRKVLVVTFILPMQSMGYNHALYFIRGDQVDGRNILLAGCHCIVNMLYYYYYCHNIVLVNKLA